MTDIMIPAATTPKHTAGAEYLGFKFINEATSEPVQPPVPGSGIATKQKTKMILPQKVRSLPFAAFFSPLRSKFKDGKH